MPARKPPSRQAPVPPVPKLAGDLSEEDRRLFEREFADVRPLREGPMRVVQDFDAPPGPVRVDLAARLPKSGAAAGLQVERDGGAVTGASHGVSRQTLRDLRRGVIRIEATCDLHGLHAEQARRRLQQFVEESVRRGRHAVAVICGRGRHSGPEGPILREVVIEALGTRALLAQVIAFASAAPAQGGEGALLLLLRRAP